MTSLSRVNCHRMMFVGLACMVLLGGSTAWGADAPVSAAAAKYLDLVGLPETLSQAHTSAVPTYTYMRSWGSEGTGDGQFKSPSFVALDSRGRVYVTDTQNNRVQKFRADGTFLGKWGSAGSGNGQFITPKGVAVDGAGRVYVADTGNDRMQKFSHKGGFRKTWGTGGSGSGEFSEPYGIVIQGGRVYVSDHYNLRVQKFGTDGSYKLQWSVSSTGSSDHRPGAVAMDPSGKVYVANMLGRVLKFEKNGAYRRQIQSWGVAAGLATDDEYLYASSPFAAKVVVLSRAGTVVTSFGGPWAGSGDGQFRTPAGLAFDAGGRRIFVVDQDNDRIQVWRKKYPATVTSSGTLAVSSVTAVPTCDGADIDFVLTRAADVSARVLNLAGRPVKTICRSMDGDAGTNTLWWNATSDAGLKTPSGQYLVEITAATEDGQSAKALARVTVRH